MIKRNWMRNCRVANTKVFWHPYTDDSPKARVEVTGWSGAHILAGAARMMPKSEDCHRLDAAIDRLGPFNDPRLGCILYVETPTQY